MEAKCLSKAQRLSLDLITTLPPVIIENILCLLPIEEAARTSILSRKWRYKWTTIPKLVFNWSTVSKITSKEKQTSDIKSARENMDRRCKLFYAIHQVLLLRRGPIHEFTLDYWEADCECFEIDQIILHLSVNHALKKLRLKLNDEGFYKLPLCVFSLHQLTDLYLSHIDLNYQQIFDGFRNLRSLNLYFVLISTKDLLHLLSNAPSLKRFTLLDNGSIGGEKDCTIIELFECLPVLENLEISVDSFVEMLVLDSIPKELPTLLIHLKYVCLEEISLDDDDGLRFLVVLIKCSPNLEKISLKLKHYEDVTWSGILEEYSNVWLEHLIELDIRVFSNCIQMEFVKFILARSPKLKKMWISYVAKTIQEEVEWLKILVRAPRVSSVEIVLAGKTIS